MPLVNRTFDQLINFTRTTAATFVGSNGLIQTTPQSRNLLLFTQEFDNAAWNKGTGGSIAANSVVSPDGTSNADAYTWGSSTASFAFLSQIASTASNVANTFSIWLKRPSGSGSRTVRLTVSDVATSTGNSSTFTVTESWQRFDFTRTSAASTGQVGVGLSVGLSGTPIAAGEVLEVWGAQLEVGSAATDYTRNFGGLFPPRFDYDPVTLGPRGLLIEEQRTNLLLRSEEFNNAAWSKINGSVTANATTSPDGTVNADLFIPDTTAAVQHRIDQTPVSSAVAQVFSVFVKASGYTWISLRVGTVGRAFNIVNGTVGTAGTMTGTITSFGNGWYRCAIAVPSPLANDICRINVENGDSVASVFAGDGTSGIFVWGAQLEAGAFATSYIPTVASQVTRAPDIAAIAAPNFASWFNGVEGTLLVEATTTAGNARAATLSAGTVTNQIWVQAGAGGELSLQVYTAGAFVAQIGLLPANATKKIAAAYKTNDFAVSIDGGAASTDTSGALGTYDRLNIGTRFDGTAGFLNGHIRSIRYYPTRLSNAQLQALTA